MYQSKSLGVTGSDNLVVNGRREVATSTPKTSIQLMINKFMIGTVLSRLWLIDVRDHWRSIILMIGTDKLMDKKRSVLQSVHAPHAVSTCVSTQLVCRFPVQVAAQSLAKPSNGQASKSHQASRRSGAAFQSPIAAGLAPRQPHHHPARSLFSSVLSPSKIDTA